MWTLRWLLDNCTTFPHLLHRLNLSKWSLPKRVSLVPEPLSRAPAVGKVWSGDHEAHKSLSGSLISYSYILKNMDHGLNTVQLAENGAPTQPLYKKYFFGTDFCKEGEITVNVSAGVLFSCVGRMVRWKFLTPLRPMRPLRLWRPLQLRPMTPLTPLRSSLIMTITHETIETTETIKIRNRGLVWPLTPIRPLRASLNLEGNSDPKL